MRDSYRDGFAILKELVQNADDAGASQLEITLLSGGARCVGHPLLDGPALIAVNNAKFDRKDEEGIMSLNESGKAGDGATIGRFGLGMKSVFHLADAFLWLASPQPETACCRQTDQELNNPWADLALYADWCDPSKEQWDAARAAIRPWTRKHDPWFCLWLPLRGANLPADGRPTFSKRGHEHALEELLSLKNGRRLAVALPLLKNLQAIEVLGEESGYRLTLCRSAEEDTEEAMHGKVHLKVGQDEFEFQYHGRRRTADGLSDRYRHSEDWPTHEADDGRLEALPANGSGAALVAGVAGRDWLDGKAPTLDVVLAVYLPLDAGGPSDPADVTLVLHGEFFVDAGRQSLVLKPNNGRPNVEADWNDEVLEGAVLPSLPSAILQFAESTSVERGRVRLIDGLVRKVHGVPDPLDKKVSLFQKRRAAVCRDSQLIPRLKAGTLWVVVSSAEPIYRVAYGNGKNSSDPFTVLANALPGLDSVAETHALVPAGLKTLTTEEPREVPPDMAANLLGPPGGLTAAPGHDEIVVPLLQLIAKEPARQQLVMEHARALVTAWAASDFTDGDLKTLCKACVNVISPGNVLEVDDGLPLDLLGRKAPVLLLPSSLSASKNHPSMARVSESAADEVLRAAMSCGLKPVQLSRLAKQVIEAVDPLIEPSSGSLVDLPLFLTNPASDVAASLSELADAAAEGLLYSSGKNWADALALAAELDVLVCETLPRRVAFQEVPACNFASVNKVLGTLPRLSQEASDRLQLTRLILESEGAEKAKKPLRHLLAGRALSESDPLLAQGATGTDGAWLDLLVASGVETAVVPKELVTLLNDEQKKILDLKHTDAGTVLDRLVDVSPEELSALALTESVAAGLYEASLVIAGRNASATQLKVLRSLPLHPTMDGRRVACTDAAFVNAGGANPGDLPRALQERITLLRPHGDEAQRLWQKKLVQDLDAAQMLDLLVQYEETAEAVTSSPDLFLQLLDKVKDLPSDLRERLAKLAWVRTPLGPRKAPRDVLTLKFSSLRWTRNQEVSLADLQETLAKGLNRHRPLMPKRDESFARLAKAAAIDDRFRVGVQLSLGEDGKEALLFDDWHRVFSDAEEVMPAVSLLREIANSMRPGSAKEPLPPPKMLLEGLSAPLADSARIAKVLNQLSGRAEKRGSPDSAVARRFFDAYLERAKTHSEWSNAILPRLRLPTRSGTWRPARNLSVRTPGVDPSHLLHETCADLLRGIIHDDRDPLEMNQRPDVAPPNPSSAAEQLREYVDGLDAPPATVGGMLAMLGNARELVDLAEERLRPRTVEGVRADVPWEVIPGSTTTGADKRLDELAENVRIAVTIRAPEKISAANLLGDRVELPVANHPESLLLGNPETFKPENGPHKGRPCWHLSLRRLPSGVLSPAETAEALRQTATEVINHIYWRWKVDLTDLWKGLSESDQIDVEVAAEMMLDQVDAHLRRLSTDRLHTFRPMLGNIDAARERLVEARRSKRKPLGQPLEDAVKAVEKLLREDPTAQAEVLEALRRKVQEHGYAKDSIPLEIFQNADDAAAELFDMHSGSCLNETNIIAPDLFVASLRSESILFAHWGRPVNKFRHGRFDGTDRGFRRDLRKMLSLSESDKLVDATGDTRRTTGRFGLGFKSVFLLSDRPRVVSGWLGFEVRGGILPMRLDPEEAKAHRDQLARLWQASRAGEAPAGGTLVDLPLREDEDVPRDLLTRFQRLAPVLVIFAKRLRRVHVEVDGGQESFAWLPTIISNVEGVEVGALARPRGKSETGSSSGEAAKNGLFLTGPSRDGLLIGLGEAGPVPLFDVPDIWVTAPTGREFASGVAVNGAFGVDPGRSQLRVRGNENIKTAYVIAERVGHQLVSLFDIAAEDWAPVRDSMGLHVGTTANGFWVRLFDVMTPKLPGPEGPEVSVVQKVLEGAAKLVQERPALPVHFGETSPVMSLRDVHFFLTGVLSESQDLRTEVALWRTWQEQHIGDRYITEEVIGRLKRLNVPLPCNAQERDLATLVEAEAGNGVGPEDAERIAGVLLPLLNTKKGASKLSDREKEKLVQEVRKLTFRNASGGWSPTADLLLPTAATKGDKENCMRAAFAPSGSVLSDVYEDFGIGLFSYARNLAPKNTGPEAMTEWAYAARDNKAQMAVLRYLAAGAKAKELGRQIKSNDKFQETPWMRDLTIRDQLLCEALDDNNSRLQVLLHLDLQYGSFGSAGPAKDQGGEMPPLPDPAEFLKELSERWQKEGPALIADYESKIYGGAPPKLDLNDLDNGPNREALTEVFLLATLHTTPYGNVSSWRNFTARCYQRGWLTTFASDPPDPASWIEVLDDYLCEGGGPQYKLEMQRFPEIYQVARYLSEYTDTLREGAKLDTATEADLFDSRQHAALSGSDIGDAPALKRALGVGRHFLLRELLRRGALQNKVLYPFCYVPVKRVRTLVSAWGGCGDTSEGIHSFLAKYLGEEGATFNGAFDLPLWSVAGRNPIIKGLSWEVLEHLNQREDEDELASLGTKE